MPEENTFLGKKKIVFWKKKVFFWKKKIFFLLLRVEEEEDRSKVDVSKNLKNVKNDFPKMDWGASLWVSTSSIIGMFTHGFDP